MEVEVQVGSGAEALNEGDRARVAVENAELGGPPSTRMLATRPSDLQCRARAPGSPIVPVTVTGMYRVTRNGSYLIRLATR